MEKCKIHNCEMVIKEMAVGWGDESVIICPWCEQEKKTSQAVFSTPRAGWQ